MDPTLLANHTLDNALKICSSLFYSLQTSKVKHIIMDVNHIQKEMGNLVNQLNYLIKLKII